MTSRYNMSRDTHHGPTTAKQEREMDLAETERERITDAIAHEITLCRSLGQGDALKAYETFQERGHGITREIFDKVEDALWSAMTLDERAKFADDTCDSVWEHLPPAAKIATQLKEAA